MTAMSVDDRVAKLIAEMSSSRAELAKASQVAADLKGGGGGGTSGGSMETRVSALETHLGYVREDMEEIRESLKVLPQLATKRDLDSWRWQWIATGVSIVALTVGGITGGLALIGRQQEAPPAAAAPQPIIIQVPAGAAATTAGAASRERARQPGT